MTQCASVQLTVCALTETMEEDCLTAGEREREREGEEEEDKNK